MKCPACNFENPDDTVYCGKCASPLKPSEEVSVSHTKTLETPTEELTRGSTFAKRYEVIEELGKGGMGKVYRVYDKNIEGEVALKLIKPEVAADKKTIERFKNELKLAREIAHRNVCKMYDLNEEEGTHYITMEYVTGEDLKSMIRMTGQLSVGAAINIGKQVCEGLDEAHRLGVIHRDLKPQNIMIDKGGNARIMDFGIARSVKGKGITGAGVMIGTPEYMSPEQVEGKEADERSDVYSLGVILYEMATGRVPFEGETPFTIGVKHKSEEPRDPKELNEQIPEDLSHVILKCLEKDKEKRYQSPGEVHAELSKMEKGIPTTERVIPERKPLTSREITVQFTLKKLFIPALVVVAVIVAAVIVWQLLPKKEAVFIPSDKPSLAVMYFKNKTGDQSLDIWRSALSDWLITDINQSKHLSVLSGARLFGVLRRLNLLEAESYAFEDLMKVAAQSKVNHILEGSLSKAGDVFRIDYTLIEASTGDIVSSDSVQGEGEESLPSMVDELTKKIKANFKLSAEEIASDIDDEVGKITSSSPEAFKYYSEGRNYHHSGDYRKSIQLMERALEIDPEFAMAYRSMAMSYNNIYLFSERVKYIQKALDLTDRLSEKERYLIEGDFYFGSEETFDKAIEAYKKLLDLYPDSQAGNNNLGNVYRSIEEWDKSIERYEVCVKTKTEFIPSYTNLAASFRAKRMYEKAKQVLEDHINNISDHATIRRALATYYYEQGELDLALAEIDKAFILNPTHPLNFRAKGDIYVFKGDLIKAEEEYRKLLDISEPGAQMFGLQRLGFLNLLLGRFKETKSIWKQALELAIKQGEKGWKSRIHQSLGETYLTSGENQEALKELIMALDVAEEIRFVNAQRGALHLKGLVFLKMEKIDEALRIADELKEMIEKGIDKKIIRLHYHLMGSIELEKGNFSKAIRYFKDALSLLSYGPLDWRADFIDSLGLAYYRAGDIEKARLEYERITSLTTGRRSRGDIYAKSFYMLGMIYEQQGLKGKAIEHYEKFLELWKSADPGIAEVEDAKKRLSDLT
ncbi:MAG: protein kinase [Candidatus Aminicenantes bacterium]|nr:protein kinase [Candidatus Aminicenantes bacterium]